MNPESFVPLAVVERSGAVESVHHGVVVVLGRDGSVVASAGDPSVIVYPRSANKPFQAVGMVEAGLSLAPDLLAVACASHSGTPAHLDAVNRLLAAHGFTDADLANTADLPLDATAAAEVLRSGGAARPLTMNCSGKHAAMLATCAVNGWPADASYLEPTHPLQRHLTAVLARLADEAPAGIGVDGCGAPAHRITALGLARAIRAVATGDCGPAGLEVGRAMAARPDLVGGPERDVTLWMQAVPGLVAKDGADGVMIAGLPDGRSVAVKVGDGSGRARPVMLAAGLAAAGVDVSALRSIWGVPVFGHGRKVGEVRATGPAAEWLGLAAPGAEG